MSHSLGLRSADGVTLDGWWRHNCATWHNTCEAIPNFFTTILKAGRARNQKSNAPRPDIYIYIYIYTLIPTRQHGKVIESIKNVWDGITYPFPNFNDWAIEVLKRICNFIPDLLEMWLLIHVGMDNNGNRRGSDAFREKGKTGYAVYG